MNRIDTRFSTCRAAGRKAFIPFITAGDPTLARTHQLVLALERAGADIIELGIPFSDPLADGKTNQEAAERALRNHVTLANVLDLVADLRRVTDIPIIFFTYLNPVFQYGFDLFAAKAAAVGVDGVLALDLPPEEARPLKLALAAHDLRMIYLIAPTSTPARVAAITSQASGFIYYVSRTGVTGERDSLSTDLAEHIALVRSHSDLPVAVGFGISTPQQVAAVAALADGVVVGSAIVRRIGCGGDCDAMVNEVEEFVTGLSAPLRANATAKE